MKKRTLLGAIFFVIVIVIIWIWNRDKGDNNLYVKTTVKKGTFIVSVTSTGELLAKNSEDIKGPDGMRRVGIYRVKIADLIDEGTIVKEGDFIAELDRTEIETKLQELSTELQKYESQFVQTKLDTTLDLREARDNLVNLKYAMEEKKIIVAQSKYEPPATIRQAEINSDKAKRAYNQAKENYRLKIKQAKAKMQEVNADLTKRKNKYKRIEEIQEQFRITAPKPGMVIYIRDWDGKKKEIGSEVNVWDPAVATLPDLSVMISKTFINEVDIRKIKVGQSAEIGVDAFPEKVLYGTVDQVANVGEQRPKTDAKVFEVSIEITGTDSTLRPSMTTSNTIISEKLEDVLYVPLEAVHTEDSLTYVFKERGFSVVRKEVVLGLVNDNEAVVEKGLDENDVIFLSSFENPDNYKLIPLEKKEVTLGK